MYDEFDNGEYYYTFPGERLHVLLNKQYHPSHESPGTHLQIVSTLTQIVQ